MNRLELLRNAIKHEPGVHMREKFGLRMEDVVFLSGNGSLTNTEHRRYLKTIDG